MDSDFPLLVAPPSAARIVRAGLWASALSSLVLLWRGRRDTGSAVAPVNAVSHWLYPHSAFVQDRVSPRYTATGAVVHTVSAMLWAAAFDWLRSGRRDQTPTAALADAALVTGVAAYVDLKLVPERLTPGFERRLSTFSTALVYAGFAAGLALAAMREAPRRH